MNWIIKAVREYVRDDHDVRCTRCGKGYDELQPWCKRCGYETIEVNNDD